MLNKRWIDKYKVKWFETDASGKLSITSICNFLQETAWNHANHLGLGYSAISKDNIAWVIISYQIELFKYPVWLDEIIVETWPSGVEKLYANREFFVKDINGNIMLKVSTKWLIIDMKSRRPQKPDALKDIMHLVNPEKATSFESFHFPGNINLEKIGSYIVKYSDIDLYGHVNNSKYIQWVMDSIPLSFIEKKSIRDFEIKFAHECKYGEEIVFLSRPKDYTLFSGIRKGDEKVIFQVKINWSDN